MPALTSQTIVLVLALVFVTIGLIGLAPSIGQALRRRRLVSNLANMAVPVYNTDEPANFSPIGATEHVPARLAQAVSVVRQPPVLAPEAEVVPEAMSIPEAVVDVPPEVLNLNEAEPEDEADADEETEVEGAETSVEDEMMAMFREVKVSSSAPATLTESLEFVSASDLLEQARELRDLLRRAA
jgi:hypothetical protein